MSVCGLWNILTNFKINALQKSRYAVSSHRITRFLKSVQTDDICISNKVEYLGKNEKEVISKRLYSHFSDLCNAISCHITARQSQNIYHERRLKMFFLCKL